MSTPFPCWEISWCTEPWVAADERYISIRGKLGSATVSPHQTASVTGPECNNTNLKRVAHVGDVVHVVHVGGGGTRWQIINTADFKAITIRVYYSDNICNLWGIVLCKNEEHTKHRGKGAWGWSYREGANTLGSMLSWQNLHKSRSGRA